MNGQLFNGLLNALTSIQGRAIDAHKLLAAPLIPPEAVGEARDIANEVANRVGELIDVLSTYQDTVERVCLEVLP